MIITRSILREAGDRTCEWKQWRPFPVVVPLPLMCEWNGAGQPASCWLADGGLWNCWSRQQAQTQAERKETDICLFLLSALCFLPNNTHRCINQWKLPQEQNEGMTHTFWDTKVSSHSLFHLLDTPKRKGVGMLRRFLNCITGNHLTVLSVTVRGDGFMDGWSTDSFMPPVLYKHRKFPWLSLFSLS